MDTKEKVFHINRILLGALTIALLPNILMFFCNQLTQVFIIVIWYIFLPIFAFVFIDEILERLESIKSKRNFNILLLIILLIFDIAMISLSLYNIFIPIMSCWWK